MPSGLLNAPLKTSLDEHQRLSEPVPTSGMRPHAGLHLGPALPCRFKPPLHGLGLTLPGFGDSFARSLDGNLRRRRRRSVLRPKGRFDCGRRVPDPCHLPGSARSLDQRGFGRSACSALGREVLCPPQLALLVLHPQGICYGAGHLRHLQHFPLRQLGMTQLGLQVVGHRERLLQRPLGS